MNVQVAVLLVGTNNHGHTPEMISDGIVAIVELIREKQPQAHVLTLVSGFFDNDSMPGSGFQQVLFDLVIR